PALQPGNPAARGPGDLPDALPGGLAWRVPGGKPRPDELPAADEAQVLLRSGDPGGDHPAGADPGRHGASLPSPPERAGEGQLSLGRAGAGAGQDAGGAAL